MAFIRPKGGLLAGKIYCRRSGSDADCHRARVRGRSSSAESCSAAAGSLQLDSNWTDGALGETGRFPISGYLVGGTVGANYQIGAYVFGIEGDADWTDLHGGSGSTCGAISDLVPPPTGCQTQSEWLATVRGRLGYTFNNVLIYGTGGAAVGNIQNGLIPPSTFDSKTETGWTIGAGVEIAFAPNWTVKAEYLFVDLPDTTCTTVANCGGAVGSTVSFNESIVRAGINFKFGAW